MSERPLDAGVDRATDASDAHERNPSRDAGDATSPREEPEPVRRDAGFDAGSAVGGSAAITPPVVDGGAEESRSLVCGDALRDPVNEECDDGPGAAADACDHRCRAHSMTVLDTSGQDSQAAPARMLGTAPHVAAGNELYSAVVLVEHDEDARVLLQRFDASGSRRGPPTELSAEAVAASVPNPAIAALPAGAFAIAWTDLSGGSPDVVLSRLDADGNVQPRAVVANQQLGGPQQDADLVWTGSELVVAWTDLFDVLQRRFDSALRPLGPERIAAGSDAIESGVALAPFAGDIAIAWRSHDAGMERVHVQAGGVEWWTDPAPPAATGDRPGIAQLDAQRLLLVFTIGTSPAIGETNPRVHVAVLSLAAPGLVVTNEVVTMFEPFAGDAASAQRRPCAVRVGEGVFLAWENDSGGELGSQIVVQQVDSSPDDTGIVDVAREWLLPIDGDPRAAQRKPALAAAPLFPYGALLATWEDASETKPEPMFGLRPSPIVELD